MRTLLLIFVLITSNAAAETIAIIGTGDVAGALGPEFATQGHRIIYGSRDPERRAVLELVGKSGRNASATTPSASVVDADIVVLAVPGLMVETIARSLGDLSGKTIIDPTNPLEFEPLALRHTSGKSNAEIIQAVAPDAHVVKAFNTLNWRIMVNPDEAGGPVSIPIVGDDAMAKVVVSGLVAGMGLEPIDVGGLENARWVEGMAVLLLNNMIKNGEPFNFYLRRNP